ncbi:DUF4065 domain-containing protein [Paenibacillus sp. LMG 31461]|uniref:DUF4065 domain-containing protein n=1 Tax=Paenibacillus plantarum TaxID=2654975 RepID=A0ABX1XI35_9BACL|nr:type II toxin-antitoxin system antitoxin SocA domain-containing protein [Paenibacillus plantarum]NOU68205.1 DUF4065 domain-containing protein [Paenibacillus plantarum]
MSKVTFNDVADYFISLSNETGNLISNLKLQKLCYYAQAWHLAIYGEELFDAKFEAWVHGPVIRDLYNIYKKHSWKPIIREDLNQDFIDKFNKEVGSSTAGFMDDIVDEYFGMTAYELESQTHKEDPWRIARKGLPDDMPCDNAIENQWMINYYREYVTPIG